MPFLGLQGCICICVWRNSLRVLAACQVLPGEPLWPVHGFHNIIDPSMSGTAQTAQPERKVILSHFQCEIVKRKENLW